MPFVEVHWFSGRSEEQKAEVAKRITDAMVEVGKAKREDVWILFDDKPASEWAFGGERPA
jgi:4-oxalocrotonate tautomerase